jgi:hypothetical protein
VHDEAKSSALANEFFPETRHIARHHGGPFFSTAYVEHVCAQHPWAWRLRMAYRLAAGRDFRGLWRAARRKLRNA